MCKKHAAVCANLCGSVAVPKSLRMTREREKETEEDRRVGSDPACMHAVQQAAHWEEGTSPSPLPPTQQQLSKAWCVPSSGRWGGAGRGNSMAQAGRL